MIIGMPAGHPFQGSQPKHLEEMNSKKQISLPRRPYLSQDSSKPRVCQYNWVHLEPFKWYIRECGDCNYLGDNKILTKIQIFALTLSLESIWDT